MIPPRAGSRVLLTPQHAIHSPLTLCFSPLLLPLTPPLSNHFSPASLLFCFPPPIHPIFSNFLPSPPYFFSLFPPFSSHFFLVSLSPPSYRCLQFAVADPPAAYPQARSVPPLGLIFQDTGACPARVVATALRGRGFAGPCDCEVVASGPVGPVSDRRTRKRIAYESRADDVETCPWVHGGRSGDRRSPCWGYAQIGLNLMEEAKRSFSAVREWIARPNDDQRPRSKPRSGFREPKCTPNMQQQESVGMLRAALRSGRTGARFVVAARSAGGVVQCFSMETDTEAVEVSRKPCPGPSDR